MKSWEILSDDDLVIYLHVFYWFVIIYTESQSEICAQKQSRIDGEMKCDRPVFDSPAVLGRPPWPSWLSASSLGPTGSTGSLSSASTAFPGVKGQRLWEGPKKNEVSDHRQGDNDFSSLTKLFMRQNLNKCQHTTIHSPVLLRFLKTHKPVFASNLYIIHAFL